MTKKVEGPETEKQGKSLQLMPIDGIKKFHKDTLKLRGRLDDSNSDLGKHIKDGRKRNLNPAAYAVAVRLDRMLTGTEKRDPKPDDVAHFLATLENALQALNIYERCNLQGRLQFDGSGKPSAEADVAGDVDVDDDKRDLRPRFRTQPGASAEESAGDAVKAAADRAEQAAKDDPLKKVGRGPGLH